MSELASITIPVSTGSLAAYNRDKYQPDNVHGTSLPYFRVKLSCVCLMFAYIKKSNDLYTLVLSRKQTRQHLSEFVRTDYFIKYLLSIKF